MAYQSLWNEYMNMPPVTRAYTTACVITTLVVVSFYRISHTTNFKLGQTSRELG